MRRPLLSFLSVLVVAGGGCLARPIEPNEPTNTQRLTQTQSLAPIDKVDILLAIDNSGSMGDKQDILAQAVPDLVGGLLNPKCIDAKGNALPKTSQPSGPLADCPAGSSREFVPITDFHVGIVTSSLDHQCFAQGDKGPIDDGGRLIARTLDASSPPEYDPNHFLDWDPEQKQTPAGEGVLGTFENDLRKLVQGAGEAGCGYEAQLESWYRFLVEPAPDDKVLIRQRNDFLRPDSLVAIVMLSDENDCSVAEDNINYVLGPGPLVAPTAICKDHPEDHCCAPCGHAPSDCPTANDGCENGSPLLADDKDPVNLRCFDQKRRFGRDFLYPVQRYIDALNQPQVKGRDGKTYDNPLFTGGPQQPTGRVPAANLVYFAGIVGVPWEDIARRDAKNRPDLVAGLDSTGAAVGGLMSADELGASNNPWGSTWDLILGDPANGVPPQDALMMESSDPRKGENPLLGVSLVPASQGNSPTANPVNGHEWNASSSDGGDSPDACIFPLKKPIPQPAGCDHDPTCTCDSDLDNPLCQNANGTYDTEQQLYAKAYPGTRQLQVLKGLGSQGIVASICPATLDDDKVGTPSYGYEPAVGAIVDRLKARLANDCLPITLKPQKDGTFPCLVIEGHLSDQGCDCKGAARTTIEHGSPEEQAIDDIENRADYACFCKVKDITDPAARAACENDVQLDPTFTSPSGEKKSVDGWCYVDPAQGVGNKALVRSCPPSDKRELRFVGAGRPEIATTTFISCLSE